MPVDRATFTREFTLLLERFGRDPHPLMTARYFEYVDRHLTTEEFTAAAREIFENDQFWPAPARFLHAAKGEPKRLAEEAWGALLQAMHNGRPADATPEAIQALKRSGSTFRDLQEASTYRLSEIERDFKREFAAARSPSTQPALPAPPELKP